MKFRKIAIAVFAAAIMQNAIAGPQEMEYINTLIKQIQYTEENQESVWPGFHPNSTASIISRNNAHAL